MGSLVLRGIAGSILVCIAWACSSGVPSTLTSPTSTAGSPPSATLPPAPYRPFPPVTRPARVFVFAASEFASSAWTLESRYVLHDDGSFVLQYERSRGSFDYPGTYTESDGMITFHWEGWSAAGPWGATATITDELLTVRYNLIMQLTDFEDAAYRRTR